MLHFGILRICVKVLEISLILHLNEPSTLYEGRDFAIGKTTWMDVDDAEEATCLFGTMGPGGSGLVLTHALRVLSRQRLISGIPN